MSNPRPVGGRLVSAAILFFAPLAVLCVLLILKRLVFGIGSVTALNENLSRLHLSLVNQG